MREMSVLQLSPAICLQDMFVPGHGNSLKSVIDTARTDRRKSEKQALGREKKLRREATAQQAASRLHFSPPTANDLADGSQLIVNRSLAFPRARKLV